MVDRINNSCGGQHLCTGGANGRSESRREFLHACVSAIRGITVIGLAAPLLQACDTTLEPKPPGGGSSGGGLTFDVSGLTADGQGLRTTVNGSDGRPIMIVRTAPDTFVALSSMCTHQGCDVNLPTNGSITCPCHGSRFSLGGAVITGPASQPLRSYTIEYSPTTQQVTITL